MSNDIRALTVGELHAVSGGMKYDPNTKNDDVIDARGGQFTVLGWTITLDIHGNVSSATH